MSGLAQVVPAADMLKAEAKTFVFPVGDSFLPLKAHGVYALPLPPLPNPPKLRHYPIWLVYCGMGLPRPGYPRLKPSEEPKRQGKRHANGP